MYEPVKSLKRIMIVEDDENIRKTFRLLLGKKYRVYAEKDPVEVLRKGPSVEFDLVIADVKLPGMTGVDFMKELRRSGYRGEAMLITAHPDLVNIESLSQLEISHFFVKPLDLKVLDVSIERVLQNKETSDPHALS